MSYRYSHSEDGQSGSGELPYAFGFRQLVVYQKSRQLQLLIFELSKGFPKSETYSLTDQIRRCSRSVGAQIAEAWAKRRYEAHFVSKLTDALGENFETEHWLDTAADCAYVTPETAGELLSLSQEISRMLNSMIAKSAKFCGASGDHLKEDDESTLSECFAENPAT